ncbi:MAG: hypothetical protein GQ574_24210 [Crocinitomix sp.]|nr:hypothetical protein [Crocinitomix sp.]
MNNDSKLPFGDFTFITSEMVVKLENNKRIVNDILALDSQENLVIIELKSIRSNKVKQQAIDFENKVIKQEKEFIESLIMLIAEKKWSCSCRKVAVWKAPTNATNIRINKQTDVELYNYRFDGLVTET